MLFFIALHPFLLDLQKKHPSTCVLTHLDDMFFAGPMDDVLSCLDNVASRLKDIGLQIVIEKCELFCNGLQINPTTDRAIQIASDGMLSLEIPIGQHQYVSDKNIDKQESCLDIAN